MRLEGATAMIGQRAVGRNLRWMSQLFGSRARKVPGGFRLEPECGSEHHLYEPSEEMATVWSNWKQMGIIRELSLQMILTPLEQSSD